MAIVLNTDPPSVMTTLGRIGVDGRTDRAEVEWPIVGPGLVDLATLVMVVAFADGQDARRDWQLRGDAAVQMQLMLDDCRYRDDPAMRFGHTSVAAARLLLRSGGMCDGCG